MATAPAKKDDKPKKNLETLRLDEIIIDRDVQQRAGWKPDGIQVQEYTELVRAGTKFPAIVVFEDEDGSTYLAGGFSRYHAHKAAGKSRIAADVRKGTKTDAIWFAAGDNKTHGFRRTNDDKRRAVMTALKLKPDMSDRSIAEHVGVSNEMVGDVRAKMETKGDIAERKEITTKTGQKLKNDKKAKAKRAASGKKGAAAKTGLPSESDKPLVMPATATINDGVLLDAEGTKIEGREMKAIFARVHVFQKLSEALKAAAGHYKKLVSHDAGIFLGEFDAEVLLEISKMIDASTPWTLDDSYPNGWAPKDISGVARNKDYKGGAE